MENSIDKMFKENIEFKKYLEDSEQASFSILLEKEFKKSFLLAIASFFENEIQNILITHIKFSTGNNDIVTSFTTNKAIKRQYHTYFNWDGTNANNFLGLFGEKFKNEVSALLTNNPTLKLSIKNFLQLGKDRNILVHQNYADFNIEKTSQEIYENYQSALEFIEFLRKKLPEK